MLQLFLEMEEEGKERRESRMEVHGRMWKVTGERE